MGFSTVLFLYRIMADFAIPEFVTDVDFVSYILPYMCWAEEYRLLYWVGISRFHCRYKKTFIALWAQSRVIITYL